MTENAKFIFESIKNQLRSGFFSADEVKANVMEEIEDNGFEDEISEEWAWEHIDEEYERLISESQRWKYPTDTEKLIVAFNELCDLNIIALHNAGYTTSDGEYEVIEVETFLRANNVVSEGYCFYHGQDLERALTDKNSCLLIAFQKIDNEDDAVTVAVGKKVVEVLKNNGFEVEWNQSPTSKIMLPNFKWQLLFDESNYELLDYEAVAERMLENKKG